VFPLRPLTWFVIACVAWAIPIVVVDIAPSGDGPQHLLAARAVADYDDDALAYARFVEPQLPLTGGSFVAILIAVLSVLPWQAAYALSLLLVLWGGPPPSPWWATPCTDQRGASSSASLRPTLGASIWGCWPTAQRPPSACWPSRSRS